MKLIVLIVLLGIIALITLAIKIGLEILRGLEVLSKQLWMLHKDQPNLEDYCIKKWPGAFIESYYFYKKDDGHEEDKEE